MTNHPIDFDIRTQNDATGAPVFEAIADGADANASNRLGARELSRESDRSATMVAEVSTTVDPRASHDSVTSSQDDRDHAGDASQSSREHDDDDDADDIAVVESESDASPAVEAVADHTSATTDSTATDGALGDHADAA